MDGNLTDYAATSSFCSSDRSTITPFSNFTPARTSATRCGCVDRPPSGLGRLDQLVGHGQTGGPRARSLGHLGAQPHGGEGGLDGVGGLQMDPVLGREGVEGEQLLAVLGELLGRPWATWPRSPSRS